MVDFNKKQENSFREDFYRNISLNVLRDYEEHLETAQKFKQTLPSVIEISETISESILKGGKLLVCGNGGSASDAQHFASELTGRYIKNRRAIPAISLATDTSAITAISNDYSYDYVFARQIEAIGKNGDCLFAISTSGNSINIVDAIEAANKINIKTIGLLGKDGGKCFNLCDQKIVIPSMITARIQELHIFTIHVLTLCIEEYLKIKNFI